MGANHVKIEAEITQKLIFRKSNNVEIAFTKMLQQERADFLMCSNVFFAKSWKMQLKLVFLLGGSNVFAAIAGQCGMAVKNRLEHAGDEHSRADKDWNVLELLQMHDDQGNGLDSNAPKNNKVILVQRIVLEELCVDACGGMWIDRQCLEDAVGKMPPCRESRRATKCSLLQCLIVWSTTKPPFPQPEMN